MERVTIDQYILDPEGDAMYVLEKPSKEVIIETSGKRRSTSPARPSDESQNKRARTRSGCKIIDPHEYVPPDEFRVQISSKHLALASRVFHAMGSGNWMESLPIPSGSDGVSRRQIRASEFDSEAVLILMRIIHGHHKDIPTCLTLTQLTNLSTIVDYYQCHEVVAIFAERWIEKLQKHNALFPRLPYGEDVIRWLSISWVFVYPGIFNTMAEIILRHSMAPVYAPDLPIAPALVAIEAKRQDLVSKSFSYVSRIHKALVHGQTNCTVPDCASMLLGTLIRATRNIEHLKEDKTRPVDGYSVTSILETLSSYRKPTWASIRHDPIGNPIPTVHRCNLEQFLQRPLRKLEAELTLQLYQTLRPNWTMEEEMESHRPRKPTRLVEDRPRAL